jgi:hypothetical protein
VEGVLYDVIFCCISQSKDSRVAVEVLKDPDHPRVDKLQGSRLRRRGGLSFSSSIGDNQQKVSKLLGSLPIFRLQLGRFQATP